MTTIVNRNIIFLDSNQFYKGKLDNHASNLEDNDFKHLLSEFPIKKLEILKRCISIWMGRLLRKI